MDSAIIFLALQWKRGCGNQHLPSTSTAATGRAAPGNSLQANTHLCFSTVCLRAQLCPTAQHHVRYLRLVLHTLSCLCSKCSISQGCCCHRPWELPGSCTGQHEVVQPLTKPLTPQYYFTHDQCHPAACTRVHCFQPPSQLTMVVMIQLYVLRNPCLG